YANQVERATIAGRPIIAHDKVELDKAIKLQLEEAMRQAEAPPEVAEAPPEPEKELVTAQ
ncbi:unnamed protein product, partial [marine sediment metagenome]